MSIGRMSIGHMVVIASANGDVGMAAAAEALREGGTALDAVEAGTRAVEANLEDHSVGVGGYPNLLGQVELDASLMEGTTRRAGAVAALQGFPHPVSVARAVLEHLPQHLLLVGEGAALFARERGFEAMPLLTPKAEDAWRRAMAGLPTDDGANLSFQAKRAQDPERQVGTVNFVARDGQGRIASAVSTSGWAFKYPGRVGDSPLIGAGNYCDDRFGACCCTGLGEWAIRAGTARTVVSGLEYGLALAEACTRAVRDLFTLPLPPGVEPVMNLIALDKDGSHAAYTTAEGRAYIWQTPDMTAHETAPRIRLTL
jgi:beta-aspartyl-peptidase (threonine type)